MQTDESHDFVEPADQWDTLSVQDLLAMINDRALRWALVAQCKKDGSVRRAYYGLKSGFGFGVQKVHRSRKF